MNNISLGKTGLEVSRMGIGGIPIQRPPEDEAIKVIQCALDLGVTLIDTANDYGVSEERIGKAIAGRRERVVIATKSASRHKAIALRHLDLSLQRLQTDYIDVWQLHNISTFKAYEQVFSPGGAMEAAQEALKVGKIRHIGISSHRLEVALKAVASGHFETIQFPLNFVSNEAIDELVPLAKKHNVGFIAMKPFAGGNISSASLAIKYLLQFDTVVPVPGVEKVEEITEIVDIVSKPWELSQQEYQQIKNIHDKLGTRFCRQCMYCTPCPKKVNIPMVMITRRIWKLLPQEKFCNPHWTFLKAVESGRNCIQCGKCEKKCPYQLPIREMIVENLEFLEHIRQFCQP